MTKTLSRYLFSTYVSTILKFTLAMLALGFLADFNEYTRRASGLPDFSLGTAAMVSLCPSAPSGRAGWVILPAEGATNETSRGAAVELVISWRDGDWCMSARNLGEE